MKQLLKWFQLILGSKTNYNVCEIVGVRLDNQGRRGLLKYLVVMQVSCNLFAWGCHCVSKLL